MPGTARCAPPIAGQIFASLPEDVRRVWSADRSADAASSASMPATATHSAASPTYAADVKYFADKVPEQFTAWARNSTRRK